MRERYIRHFLQNVVELSDGLGIYYVQDCFCDRSALFGVELKSFFDHHQSVEWLRGCMIHNRLSIYNLRSFLVKNAPRRYMVHRMSDRQVVDEVARIIIDYDYPVVIRPWHEPPWRASNTIDVICAIQNGAPLSVMSRSPELDQAVKMLKSEVQKHSQGAAQSYHENLLAHYDIDPNDVDTASSPWDVERWKQEHQQRLAARREALQPHSPQGWNDPDAPKKVIANVVKILAGAPKQILQHPIDSLIIEPIKEFVGMFKAPKADPDRDQARHNVQGRYYQSKDIDPNDLDTADHPGRAMQWVDSYNKRHQNDRRPAKVQIPSPEETENILAMLISFLVARKYAKAVRRGSGAMAEETAVTAKQTAKAKAGTKGMPEVENPKDAKKIDNKTPKEYDSFEKSDGQKKTSKKNIDTSRVLVEKQPKSLKRVTSSGTRIVANPDKTTTILGRFDKDMASIINELKYPKNTDFGGKKGGFNVLNVPDKLYKKSGNFWKDFNKPFLDAAIDRGDDIVMATKPTHSVLKNPHTGELTGFGKEYKYLLKRGYKYDSSSSMMVKATK